MIPIIALQASLFITGIGEISGRSIFMISSSGVKIIMNLLSFFVGLRFIKIELRKES